MPMAMAANMPTQQDEATEMNMTPMAPMSMAHCEQCTHVDDQNNAPMSNSCAGHCLAKAHDALAALTSVSSANQISVALAPSIHILVEPTSVAESSIISPVPPINLALARSVVMIQ